MLLLWSVSGCLCALFAFIIWWALALCVLFVWFRLVVLVIGYFGGGFELVCLWLYE